MMNVFKVIIGLNLIISCSSQSNKVQTDFNCSVYKQFSKETDLTIFSVAGMDFKSINSDNYKLTDEYPFFKEAVSEQEVYFYSYLKDDCELVLLTKSRYNNRSIRLYLVSLSDSGEIIDKLLLADESDYPGSSSETKSLLKNGELTVIKTDEYMGDYIEELGKYTTVIDSVTIKYKPSNTFYKQVFKDSVRVER